MNKQNWDSYIKWGMTAFFVLLATALCVILTMNVSIITAGVNKIVHILAPIIYGMVLAYLIAPIYNKVVKFVHEQASKVWKKGRGAGRLARVVGTLVALFVYIFIVFGLVYMIIPELYNSVMNLTQTLPQQLPVLYDNVMENMKNYPEAREMLQEMYDKFYSFMINFTNEYVIPNLRNIVNSISIGIFAAIKSVANIVIGFIVMVYLLNEKEKMIGQLRKISYSVLGKNRGEILTRECETVNEIFGGFIIGKIIDSIIIGVLCFIILTIMDMPYTMLISVIVGVTNVIPFFGPYIGAIPSFILILLVNPIQSLYFVIMIIILQQFDGNILGPKILGDSTGLSSFWVLFAILLFGGMFGIVGMIIGVPTWAVILNFIRRGANHMLQKKGLTTESDEYLSKEELKREKI